MADKEQIIKEKFDYSGLFDFNGFYSYAHNFLKEDKGYGVVEEKYSEKVNGNNRDITFEWTCTKKMGDYFNFEIKMKIEAGGMSDVEVDIDGQKKKMNKGKISGELKANFIKDPSSKWDTSPLNRFLKDIYNKWVIPNRVEDTKSILENDVKGIKEEFKAYLELTGRR